MVAPPEADSDHEGHGEAVGSTPTLPAAVPGESDSGKGEGGKTAKVHPKRNEPKPDPNPNPMQKKITLITLTPSNLT